MKYNFKKVFETFEKNYILVPLEIFGNDPYKTLVSTIMSARTKDETTLAASNRLFKKASNLRKLGKLTQVEIEKLIYPVGFYKTKAKHLSQISKVIDKLFEGKIPATREGLTKLPGVGIKTANLVLNRAFAKPAIAVDTHVHRITNVLGWVKTKTPEETEKALHKVLPQKYWERANRLFVSIGRQYTTNKRLMRFLEENQLFDTKKQ